MRLPYDRVVAKSIVNLTTPQRAKQSSAPAATDRCYWAIAQL
jgi:hypothetical protein